MGEEQRQTRRSFLFGNMKQIFVEPICSLTKELKEWQADETSPAPPATATDYFASYETCYAFLAEVSLEELQQDALRLGIDFAGKSKVELARLIFDHGAATAPQIGKGDSHDSDAG
jgi:hypothetical protein